MAQWGGEAWGVRIKARWGFAALAGLATASLYAEGVLKNGWIEVALLAPVVWFLVAPGVVTVLQNLLVSLIALCLMVSGLDLALRPVFERRLNYTPLNIYSHKLPALPIVGRWDSNLNLVDDLYGDLAALAGDPTLREPRQIEFRTDSAGFRNTDANGPVDLLVIGDSFGAGWGTTQDAIFARLLETRYGRHTYNLSYPGGPYDQYINLAIEWSRLVLAQHPKMVWTIYTGNDLDDAAGETWDLDALPWRSQLGEWVIRYRTFRNRSPLNRLLEVVRSRWSGAAGLVLRDTLPDGRPILFLKKHEAWASRPRTDVEHHPNFSKLERTMAAMRTLTAKRGIDVTVLLVPTKGEVYRWVLDRQSPRREDFRPSGFSAAVLGICERVHLRCLDLKPYLVAEARRLFDASGELLWWRDDSHVNEQGHAAIATFIAREVLEPSDPVRPRRGGGNRRL